MDKGTALTSEAISWCRDCFAELEGRELSPVDALAGVARHYEGGLVALVADVAPLLEDEELSSGWAAIPIVRAADLAYCRGDIAGRRALLELVSPECLNGRELELEELS